ncbi:unnamed protein product [Meganyctiphanes norvegica]|uniref:Uncharacterized protein n=1 Tax=Meganyctiphanes norvegica TaxID=48144 RepID=A0AAV2PZS6_MEGNR
MQNSSPEIIETTNMGSNNDLGIWPPWPSDWLHGNDDSIISRLALDYQPWICSIIASSAIGLAGVVPLLLFPDNYQFDHDWQVKEVRLQERQSPAHPEQILSSHPTNNEMVIVMSLG